MISEPFDGEWRHVTVVTDDDAELACYVHDPSTPTPHTATFVLAHGWTLTHRSWHKVANRLVADDDVRIVVWDHRGHGESTLEHGQAMTGDQSMDRLADDIAIVIEELAPATGKVIVAGHSLGAMAAIAFAARHRDVLRQRVSGVGLVSASVEDVAVVGLPGGTPLLKVADVLPLRPGRLVPATLEKWLAFGDFATDEDVADIAGQTGSTRLSTTGAFYEAVRDLNLTGALEALEGTRVEIVVGEKDQLTPVSHARLIADAVSTSRLHIVPGAGHVVMYESPDAVHAALRNLLPNDADLPGGPRGDVPRGDVPRNAVPGDDEGPAPRTDASPSAADEAANRVSSLRDAAR